MLKPPPEAKDVDKTSFGGLLTWFKVWRRGKDQEAGRFAQVGRDLGLDPEAKLKEFVGAMEAGGAAGSVERHAVYHGRARWPTAD